MIYHDLRCICLRVQRTASTAMSKTLAQYSSNLQPMTHPHWSAVEYRRHFPELFRDYWTFGVVRNPWARWLSWYSRQGGKKYRDRFSDYVYDNPSKLPNQASRLCAPDNTILVDYVGRFDALSEAWQTVCDTLALGPVELPKIQKSVHVPYVEFYQRYPAAIELVREHAARDMLVWGFEFGGPDGEVP